MDDLGLYLSVPFCRAKCSFCNFASDAFGPGRMPAYIDALCREIEASRPRAHALGAALPDRVDTIYFGGGTPSLLSPEHIRRIFSSIRSTFNVRPDAEITVECAPGQIGDPALDELQRGGVNRLSFGVQSFVDRESAAIGRLHTAGLCIAEIRRVRSAGILNLSLDLIAGLPHQTESSWRHSVASAISTGIPHLSIYMLEIDEGSRLGREVLEEGARYGVPSMPSDDQTADLYEIACTLLHNAGILQYEISNFARPGFGSAHNLKYWQRKPYLGLGLDAHSMLRSPSGRFASQTPPISTPTSPLLPRQPLYNSHPRSFRSSHPRLLTPAYTGSPATRSSKKPSSSACASIAASRSTISPRSSASHESTPSIPPSTKPPSLASSPSIGAGPPSPPAAASSPTRSSASSSSPPPPPETLGLPEVGATTPPTGLK